MHITCWAAGGLSLGILNKMFEIMLHAGQATV